MNKITIDISNIIENGDNFERCFMNWLNNHRIFWKTLINTTKIVIREEDYQAVKGYWPEIKIAE